MSVAVANKENIEPAAELLETEAHEPTLQNTIEWSDSLLAHLRALWHHRELLYLITQREIKVRYKQTALGAAWAILQTHFR